MKYRISHIRTANHKYEVIGPYTRAPRRLISQTINIHLGTVHVTFNGNISRSCDTIETGTLLSQNTLAVPSRSFCTSPSLTAKFRTCSRRQSREIRPSAIHVWASYSVAFNPDITTLLKRYQDDYKCIHLSVTILQKFLSPHFQVISMTTFIRLHTISSWNSLGRRLARNSFRYSSMVHSSRKCKK